MIFKTIDEALRSVRDDDLFVDGMKAVYLKSEEDRQLFKELIEANKGITSDELVMIAIDMAYEKKHERSDNTG